MNRLDAWHLVTPLRVVLLVASGLLAAVVIRVLVGRLVRRLPGSRDRSRAELRASTLSTVLRSTLVALVWLIVAVTVIGELGVNLGAFVATATIIGGALAFGAQTLVRDLIAGLFVIAEDQYGVGDVVDLGHASGKVEGVTLRSTRLRDSEGRVWFVPNGQIVRVANLSQEYSNAVLDIPFPITTAIAEARSMLDVVLAGFNSEDLFDAPVVLGVHDVSDDRYEVRISVRCRPGRQSEVRRMLRAGLVEAIQRGDLPAPPPGGPTVIVVNGSDSSGSSQD